MKERLKDFQLKIISVTKKFKLLMKKFFCETLPEIFITIKKHKFFNLVSTHRVTCMGILTVILAIIAALIIIPPFVSEASRRPEAYLLEDSDLEEHILPAVVEITPTPTPSPSPTPTPTPDPTLRFGDENERVQELQERLMDLNYMDLDESTQYYGPATQYAVELFQRQHDLDMDGVAGPLTLDILFSDDARKYTLLQGTRGNDVDSLQRQLVDLGYMTRVTGYYGEETVAAVIAFQERNGIIVDGKTGEQTLSLIYSPNALPSASQQRAEMRRANILAFIEAAENQIGKPYVLGAVGPNAFDCSGLVYYALREAGSSRGRYNAAGYAEVTDWERISSMDNLQIGDLMFFSTGGRRVGHVGIYIGNGMMIDASSSNGRVVKRSCTTSFWTNNFVHARRPW